MASGEMPLNYVPSETLRSVNGHHGGQLPGETSQLQQFRLDTRLSQPTGTSKRKFLDDHVRISLPAKRIRKRPLAHTCGDAKASLLIRNPGD